MESKWNPFIICIDSLSFYVISPHIDVKSINIKIDSIWTPVAILKKVDSLVSTEVQNLLKIHFS